MKVKITIEAKDSFVNKTHVDTKVVLCIENGAVNFAESDFGDVVTAQDKKVMVKSALEVRKWMHWVEQMFGGGE